MNLIYLVIAAVILVVITLIGILSRFRKCPSDKILVIHGKTGGNHSAKCIHGGAAFVLPVLQAYGYMSLKPLQFECNLQKALSNQTIRVDVPTTVTVAISTEPEIMQNAAERILNLNTDQIKELVIDIVYGQMRTVIADMSIEALNTDRDQFLEKANNLVAVELRKLGLHLINLNITDIKDEAGYLQALGQKAKAEAINNANVDIAKADKDGAIQVALQKKEMNANVADAEKDEAILIAEAKRAKETQVAKADSERDSSVAEHQRDREINVADSQSKGAIGQINAKKAVVKENANLEVIQAEAHSLSKSAEVKAQAEIEKARELSLKDAEEARALKVQAKLTAEQIVPAEIDKRNKLINAEAYQLEIEKRAQAEANQKELLASGQAKAVALEGEGKAKAINLTGSAEAEIIRQKGLAEAEAKEASMMAEANGFKAMVEVAESNPQVAIQWKMVDQWKEISREQVKAFEHINLGNVTIMDTSNGNTLSDVMKGLISTVSPVLDVMKSMEIPGVSNALQAKTVKTVVENKSLKKPSKDFPEVK